MALADRITHTGRRPRRTAWDRVTATLDAEDLATLRGWLQDPGLPIQAIVDALTGTPDDPGPFPVSHTTVWHWRRRMQEGTL